jgi:membrane protein implicated in regulation of membrane protease activity
MNYRWPLRIGKFLAIAAVIILAISYIVMGLWNALIPDLFKGPVITYWQAVGLLLLSHFLLHGWGRWRYPNGWRHRHWRNRWEERLAAMTPEEREKYKEEWRRRCGWYPGEESEKDKQSKT